MSGIAIFLPSENMCRQAQAILDEKENHVIVNKATSIETVVEETRKAIELGANIVVARGHQASDVKQYTGVPVVEVVMTAQELGLLIIKAKKMVDKPHPKIGLFCWEGMLCDTAYFEQLYDVEMYIRYFTNYVDWLELLQKGISDGIDVIIGGEKCVRFASLLNFPVVFLETTGESIGLAINQAETMYRLAEFEKHSYAQFNTVLDSSINGIIKVDAQGMVQIVNRAMEEMLERPGENMTGRPVTELFPSMDSDIVERVLAGQEETASAFVNDGKNAMVVIMEPIVVEKSIKGAILSCSRTRRQGWTEDKVKEKLRSGFVAGETLEHLQKRRPGLKPAIELAKIYAQSSSPILVVDYTEAEIESFCQGIHNYSLRRNGPFVVVNLANIPESEQMHALFGITEAGFDRKFRGAVMKADDGTLVIRAADKMTLPVQKFLLNVIRRRHYGLLDVENESIQRVNVRVIACVNKDLQALAVLKKFREDLYYLLKAFCIALPKTSERRGDTELLLEEYVRKYLEKYSRYHILTPEAREKILSHPWHDYDIQLDSFCERMILTARKRRISGEYVQELLDELYRLPESAEEKQEEGISFVDNSRLVSVREALLRHNGNRAMAAADLNISKSTLWRYMKKYHLD